MEKSKDTIVAKAYDLLKYSLPMLENLPRSQKYTLDFIYYCLRLL